jgi:hypothetical protein
MYGAVSAVNCTFTGNIAAGGNSLFGHGGSGYGGAIFNLDGTVSLTAVTLPSSNAVTAGTDDAGNGSSGGSAVYNLAYGSSPTGVAQTATLIAVSSGLSSANLINNQDTAKNAADKALAITITPYSVTYDGNSHQATGTALGGSTDLTSLLHFDGTTHINATGGTVTDIWTFAGNINYQATSGTVTDSIAKADANITVTSYSVKYDGNAHQATGSASGVESMPVNLTSLLHLAGTTHTNATSGTVNDGWTFDGNSNYNAASGTLPDSIAKADANITVTGYSFKYDGNAHTATGSAAGVESTPANLAGLLHLAGTTHTNATSGTVNDGWTFDGNSNYNAASGTVPDSIAKADANITVTSYSVKYDGNAHQATGSASGVESTPANLTSLLHLAGTTHTNATSGTVSDAWSFDGNSNYNAASGTVPDSIAKADANITVTGYNFKYDGNAHTATGSAAGVESTPANLTSLLHLAGTTHTNATSGTVSDGWSFDGNSNYNAASGPVPDSIAPAALAITANNATKITGEANPAFTVKYSGFVNGEGPGVLGGALAFNLTAMGSTTYVITPLGVTAGNYTIKFVAGTLTVQSFGLATTNLQQQVDAAGLQPQVQSKLDVWLQSASSAFSQASHWGSALTQNRTGSQMLRQLVFEVGSLRGQGIAAALADAWIAAAQEIINAVG